MAGAPGFIGAFAKDLLFTVQLGVPGLLPGIALVVNAAMVVVAGVVAARPFLGKPMEADTKAKEPPLAMLAPPMVLAVLGLLFGLQPASISAALIEPAAGAILGRPTGISLGEKQGDDLVVLLSFAALGVGVVMYLGWTRLQPRLAGLEWLDRYGPDSGYGRVMAEVSRIAGAVTRRVQSGSLRRYVALSVAMVFGGAGVVLVASGGLAWPRDVAGVRIEQVALVVLIIAGIAAAALMRALFAQVMGAALVGFGIGLLFLTLGAPDLAFTQFTVEVIAVVLLVAILARLPFRALDARRGEERRQDAWLAAIVGVVGMAILLAVLSVPFDTRIPEWMGQAAVPDAKGRNVVNVVIVDFRALDTLGEIAVLLVAALAAAALLAKRKGGKR
jgi:multicomponent Na+:H+ antiporter subunit A